MSYVSWSPVHAHSAPPARTLTTLMKISVGEIPALHKVNIDHSFLFQNYFLGHNLHQSISFIMNVVNNETKNIAMFVMVTLTVSVMSVFIVTQVTTLV